MDAQNIQAPIKRKNKILYITLLVILCITSLAGGFTVKALLNRNSKTSTDLPDNNANTVSNDPTPSPKPKFVASPINGVMLEQSRYDEIASRPPLAVMIQNHSESRPQAGINEADVVYETLAEGGITRFMGVFWSKDASRVMSIRSARKYFVDLTGDYKNVVYMHEGYADGADNVSAIKSINANGVKSLGFGSGALQRDKDCQKLKAIEHCAYTSTPLMWDLADKRSWKGDISKVESWKYKDESTTTTAETTNSTDKSLTDFTVNFPGSTNEYNVNWKYDSVEKNYKRYNINGSKFNDSNAKQVFADAIIYQKIVSFPANDTKHHMVQNVIGEGTGYVMQDGKVYNITWKKASYGAKTKFYDATTKEEFALKRGKIWDILISNTVDYKENTPAVPAQ